MGEMEASLDDLRLALRRTNCADEAALIKSLSRRGLLPAEARQRAVERARSLVESCRGRSHKADFLDAFLQQFGLSSREGVALMCLAEALLRVDDEGTADRLIAEKIQSGDWGAYKGHSQSRFVNATVWGLMLTGHIVRLEGDITEGTGPWLRRLVSSLGEPVVRQAILQAMRIMGSQFVLGRNIREGLANGPAGNRPGTRFSFDMLGEGARTMADAERYLAAYQDAIAAIAADNASGASVENTNGISVKLSALHPRYEFRQRRRVLDELLPKLHGLALQCRQAGMAFNIDAEEAERLDLSLDLFEALARDTGLRGWGGLGFVLQAYQKRGPAVADWLIALARQSGQRLLVRLVKGAYWDGEIMRAQNLGLADYPVWTRKCHSDLSYELCAARLLSAPDAVYPQFATHNAHTVAVVQEMAQEMAEASEGGYEFQRLHGMGGLLFDVVQKLEPETRLRVYAPIGDHRDLLPYLVRRLLENGANSSFVNRFLDAKTPVAELVQDPLALTEAQPLRRHPRIPRPQEIYRDAPQPWAKAAGLDLSDPLVVRPLLERMKKADGSCDAESAHGVFSPTDGRRLGEAVPADEAARERALSEARAAQPEWEQAGVAHRAECLEKAAELLEAAQPEFMALITAEAGRTIDDALSEVQEAVDFCRYYAAQARAACETRVLPGPTGEVNELSLHGRGVFLCISPWNFPLAIFIGQVAAALAAGNSVIAKPAEQTPLTAGKAVALLHQAGVPRQVLHLLTGDGATVGAALVADPRIDGVAFTGGTDTARAINRALAARDGPIAALIAETGGLNVMIVDGTALPEQVVDDVITSAFRSAGQRCSACRVLYLQEDIFDAVIPMLCGAMAELHIGDPARLSTDVGPVIDAAARDALARHSAAMEREARLLFRCDLPPSTAAGSFFPPTLFEIDRLSQLPGEVFGPILHVIRYPAAGLAAVMDEVNGAGYGLTLGVHSRIDGFAAEVFARSRVGNVYINRNMVGAVVGVNPFGGRGLSGTGPKAGGPHYLPRFATEKTRTDNTAAKGGNMTLFTLPDV